MADRPRMIIDCDPGHDDALAILLADHLADVVGVTTVSGNAPLAAVTANAQSLVTLLGSEVPVHAGAAGPLTPGDGRPRHATHVHGESGLDGVDLPPRRSPAGEDAVDWLLDTSRREQGLWLVAIGPLTNVAQAIVRDPEFVRRLAGISIMGGSTRGGNVTAAAEFNIWADPEAADVVFRSGASIRLCGLNLTHQLKTSEALLQRIRAIGTTRGSLAAQIIEYLHGRMLELTGEAAAALHDPCAVLAVAHPELFEFASRPVAVSLDDPLTRGMTVIDERFAGRNDPHQAEVAYRIDPDAALELLIDALAAEPRSPP
jgi:inosine-uridine nucleoside N-ribohydrolase